VRRGVLVLIGFFATLGLVEAFLRIQGIVQLRDFDQCGAFLPDEQYRLTIHSDPLPLTEHRPATFRRESASPAAFRRGTCGASSQRLTLLFLGDSWVEEGGLPRGVAEQLARDLRGDLCIEVINGGISSYAPSIMLLAGEQLIRKHAPDAVFINIDDTDLMDETVRYQPVTVRDEAGRIVGVLYNQPPEQILVEGFCSLERRRLFLVRLIERFYLVRVFMPHLRSLYQRRVSAAEAGDSAYEVLLRPQLAHDPTASHAAEIAYFRDTVGELLTRLSTAMGSPDRVLVTYHPHLLGVETSTGSRRYNDIVPRIVAEECRKRDVEFYDAGRDLRAMYGNELTRFFRWPKDPFSHLTSEGTARYGEAVGRRFLERIAALIEGRQER
jgi:hypothetical protein